MCGIACLASPSSGLNCYKALEKLDYRGYDSSGMAGLEKDKIVLYKRTGSVKNIESFAKSFNSPLVISHTRWATHGGPTEENAHPHLSFDGSLALVHNGIIENYQSIKNQLSAKGIPFKSQTDSEVVASLIALQSGTPLEKLSAAISQLEGSFAFGVLFKEEKIILATRRHSPLYVAPTRHGNMIASDVVCFIGLATKFYPLKEGEIVCVSQDKIELYNQDLEKIDMSLNELEKDENLISLNGYEYYMEKEINEIPIIMRSFLSHYRDLSLLRPMKELFSGVDNIALVGCGTAYHAAMFGAKVLGDYLNIPAHAYIASELKYSRPHFKNTLAIFVSQSGETADTLGCVPIFRDLGLKTLAITNVQHSALARQCHAFLPVCAGVELAVASTKAYVAQILTLYTLARYLAEDNFDLFSLSHLPEAAERMLTDYSSLSREILPAERVFFIGRQLDSITSLEAALKLKEITYKSAEGYPAGELKHGTLALIDKGTPVVVFATNENLYKKTMANATEVKARGGKTILVAPEHFEKADCDFYIPLPTLKNEAEYSLISIIPFQYLAFLVCRGLNYNPDKPRNLAKSVTVE